jgi:hypothetical protein
VSCIFGIGRAAVSSESSDSLLFLKI